MTIGGFSRGGLFVANGPTLATGEARIGTDARGEVITNRKAAVQPASGP